MLYQEDDDLEKQLLLREDEDTNHRENELGFAEKDEDNRSVVQKEIGNICKQMNYYYRWNITTVLGVLFMFCVVCFLSFASGFLVGIKKNHLSVRSFYVQLTSDDKEKTQSDTLWLDWIYQTQA